ncbi:MAG TPA: phenylalanine--tRNA ligase subunit beta [Rickettsiales bacterium]|nr:phenylalanine--tRNA ligase subunit beta [Rickettsiales bacterium]
MKFTLKWLKEHLDTSATIKQITDTLTAIGLEVEQVTDNSAALKDFIVAEIKEAVQHPNADKLRVCQVNDGSSVRQVVCGAPNARAGIKVVLATEGVKVPANGMVIKKSAIRGVESNGMLCSASELGLSEDSEGIIELPAAAVPGASLVATLGLDDPTIEIAITPNRADCLGVHGVARDLAAAGLGTLKDEKHASAAFTGNGASPITVTLATPACPLFIGCYIKGVKNGPSPEWLQQRLKAIGLRPISALVDITNYMTFTYGRPLHVFDAKKLKGNITVRYAKDGEKLAALNDKEYSLTSDMVAVCDESGVVGLGGIIGGTATGCSDDTTDVFLEAALFDPIHVASTGRALAIDSDARYRFERGVDPEFVQKGAEIAVAMILELCGGAASNLTIAGAVPQWKRDVTFAYDKIASLGGMEMPKDKAISILNALGFTVQGDKASVPSWRADIDGPADLVEEVIRIAGYDAIPSRTLPPAQSKPPVQRASVVRKTLAATGMTEVCSWAFLPEAQAKQFAAKDRAPIKLLNPISADLDAMRPNLLPNLLSALARNTARGFASLALFETGNVFEGITPQGHVSMAAGIRSGDAIIRNPLSSTRTVDLFDAKADLFTALEACGLNPAKLQVDRNVPAWYHPSRSGRISLGGKVTLGYFGELHPLTLASFDIKGSVAAFELLLDNVPTPKAKGKAKPALTVSNFQATQRDFAFIADARTSAADIIKAIESADKQLIQSVDIFDIYSGKGVEEGKKSIAVSVTLQAADRTLSDKEITDISQKILQAAQALGLSLRS